MPFRIKSKLALSKPLQELQVLQLLLLHHTLDSLGYFVDHNKYHTYMYVYVKKILSEEKVKSLEGKWIDMSYVK